MATAIIEHEELGVAFAKIAGSRLFLAKRLGVGTRPALSASSASRDQADVLPGSSASRASRLCRSASSSPRKAANQARSRSTSNGRNQPASRCSTARRAPPTSASEVASASLASQTGWSTGRRVQTGVKPPGRLVESTRPDRQVGLAEPDAIVVGSPSRASF